MFGVDIRLQVASAVFLVIIAVKYFCGKRLPMLSTKFFSLLMVLGCVNMFFDLATVYTVSHISEVPTWLNDFLHRCFIISVNSLPITLFAYVLAIGREQKRIKRSQLPLFVPYVVSVIYACFGRIDYHIEPTHAYSYGPAPYTIFACTAFYMVMVIIASVRMELSTEKRRAVIGGACFWIVAIIFQAIFPFILVSGMAVSAVIMFVYLSLENPREHRDADTGCFNKRAFHLMTDEIIGTEKNYQILNVVIDNLSYVMTKNGHEQGNRFMAMLAEFLESKTSERVFHTRGNTLTVIIKGSVEQAMPIAEMIADRLKREWEYDGFSVTLEGHISIISCPEFAESSDEIYNLMNYMADTVALDGEVKIQLATDEIIKQKRRVAVIEEILRKAINEDGFSVVYQPIYSVKDKTFSSCEALVRLNDTETVGYVSPDVFIPIAEKNGMITSIGQIVLEKVCRFARRSQAESFGLKYVEVNLSAIQCTDLGLPEQIEETLKRFDISPSFINLEITETAAVESGNALAVNIQRLKEMQCSFSMDDFGTGYSNLSKVAEMSYDLIKLDKSLITPCMQTGNEKALVILRNVVKMISQLNIKIVAEGVETKEELDLLTEMGVDYIQGYYFSKPLSEIDYIDFLEKHSC